MLVLWDSCICFGRSSSISVLNFITLEMELSLDGVVLFRKQNKEKKPEKECRGTLGQSMD
jgi:hypothetical protein